MNGEEKQGITPMGGKIIDASFDHTELVHAQLEPLINDIYNICDRNNIPCFIAVGVKCNADTHVNRVAALFPGARTPQNFRAMFKLERDPAFAVEVCELRRTKYAEAPPQATKPAGPADDTKPGA